MNCELVIFLLWQIAYAELYFSQVLWPDFNEEEFEQAVQAYQSVIAVLVG